MWIGNDSLSSHEMITDLEAYRRKQAGAKAKEIGDSFESLFETMCYKHRLSVTRFPNGCKRVEGNKLVQIKTPWDWIVTHDGTTALLDTKTSAEISFPHSKITGHQISEMRKHEVSGAKAGYVIWLRESDVVVYIPASELETLARTRGSIRFGQNHVQLLGTPSYFDVRIIFRKDPQFEPQNAG